MNTNYECRRCGVRHAHWSARCVGQTGTTNPVTGVYEPSGKEHAPQLVRPIAAYNAAQVKDKSAA
jgi:predicted ATP-dependent serine protease